ncbi:MAG: hypothetical protein ACYS18_12880 [Planctomycetota bacterium]|jgi:hypothetical protein
MAWNNVREKKGEAKKQAAGKVVELRPSEKGPSSGMAGEEKLKSGLTGGREKDLAGGMEILELDFLLGVVESTEGDDRNDVTMRRLVFNELLRRQQVDTIDSNALKFYALNKGNHYGKVIQCEAIKMLTERTVHKSKVGG